MRLPRLLVVASLLGLAALPAAGCGGGAPSTASGAEPVAAKQVAALGTVPESARLAPADATAFVTVVTDPASEQWARAGRFVDLIPGAREALDDAVRSSSEVGWEQDVKPAIGPELVVVVTKTNEVALLMQPKQPAKLLELLRRNQADAASAELDGWTVYAERQSDLDAYLASVEGGRLDTSDAFRKAMESLPGGAAARAYVNGANLTESLGQALQQSSAGFDFSLGTITGAIEFRDDGLWFQGSVETPDGDGTTRYEPKLFRSVPGDALAVISFGGTQQAVATLRDRAGLGEASKVLEEATGLSLDRMFDLFSGEGVLYVREGAAIPEVTLVLAPGDAEAAFATVDDLVRKLAESTGKQAQIVEQDGIEVRRLDVDPVNLSYALVDGTVIVTTGASGIRLFRDGGDKLVDNADFKRAAADVGLGELTAGFAYVDIDGLIPLVEGLADTADQTLPDAARDAIGAFDSFVVQVAGNGKTGTMTGFVRLNG